MWIKLSELFPQDWEQKIIRVVGTENEMINVQEWWSDGNVLFSTLNPPGFVRFEHFEYFVDDTVAFAEWIYNNCQKLPSGHWVWKRDWERQHRKSFTTEELRNSKEYRNYFINRLQEEQLKK